MRIVELRTQPETAGLRESWDRLAAHSGSVFLTWDWFQVWWSSYGQPACQLRVLLVYDDAGLLRAIAPLREQAERRSGQTRRTIRFAVDGSNDSEYLDFLVAPEDEPATRAALAQWVETECRRGAVLLLNEIPAASPTLTALRAQGESAQHIWLEKQIPCATAALPATFDAYVALLKPRFRTKVRSTLKAIEARQEFQFGFCRSQAELNEILPCLFDLHARRWATEGKPGVFGWDAKRRFYADLSRRLFERGWLTVSWLRWNGTVIACQYGFTYGGVYFHLQEGYEPACEHLNPGIALRAWSIREFIAQGVKEYDFLGGINRHKTDWGAGAKMSANVELAKSGLRGWLFSSAPELAAQARESLAAAVPERLHEVRRSLLAANLGPASDWLRTHAASAYLNLGLPALTKPIRERYTLSLHRNGAGGPGAVSRRRKPCGRILYYHRVNNDNDPFFPAIGTALFDQHMKYLARHYNVVSLSEMLECMNGGKPNDVVAITFDDGYRDNYENAFPILRRYGLPATIFLTTGALDSGEGMWFEQLAGALQASARESVDTGIDVPRRHWLRTQQERLEANDVIYSLLRKLPDAERRTWLDLVLKELACPRTEKRMGKMLTWDQVRLMSGQGIDFGGHTVNHPFISRLAPADVLWEAKACKQRIEEELQRSIAHFAYPSGREDDFGIWNKEVIRAAGYQAAVTTIWGLNDASTDCMELRRGGPWEPTAGLFASKLDWYQLTNG